MKQIWNRISKNGKFSKISEFYFPVIAIVLSICLTVLNFIGVLELSQSALLSIVIILLTVLVGTNLVERFGVLSSISEKIVAPGERYTLLTVREEYEKSHLIDENFNGITEIDIMAIANTSFLRGNGITILKNAANKKIKVKLLSIDPGSQLAGIYEYSKILNSTSIPLQGNIDAYKTACASDPNFKCHVEMKVCDIIIPYSMIIMKKNNKVISLKLDLYTNNVDYNLRRSIIIHPSDKKNIQFFLDNWKFLWGLKNNRIIS